MGVQTKDRRRVTVVLACAADGSKLTPVVISKGDDSKEREPTVLDGISVWKQKWATMTAELMVKWIQFQYPVQPDTAPKRLLIFDSFSGHLTKEVKEELQRRHVHVAVIPAAVLASVNHWI